MLVSTAISVRVGERPQLVLDVYVLGVLGPVLSILDLRLQRIPDAVVLPGVALAGVQVLAITVLQPGAFAPVVCVACGVVMTLVVLGAIALLPGDLLGWGDVKVGAGLLAPVCAWVGLPALLEAGLLAFGCAAAGLMTSRRREARRALGPYLFLAALVVVLWHR